MNYGDTPVDVDDPAVLARIISLWNEGESVQRIAFIIDSTYWRVYARIRRSNLRRYFQLDATVKSDIAKAMKSDPACVKNQKPRHHRHPGRDQGNH